MYSLSSVSKHLILVHILALVATQLLLIRSVSSLNMTNSYLNHKCFVSQGKYKPGSAHEKSLEAIIHSISVGENVNSGYDMMSFGDGPDLVCVVLQCRGDSYGSKCRSCFASAMAGLRRRCPRYKGGIIWFDQCLLEISSIDNVGQLNYGDSFCMSNAKNVGDDPFSFILKWDTLFDNISRIAITEKNKNLKDTNKPALYGAGEKRLGTKKKMYGMVQCTDDLSVKACEECLVANILKFQNCWKSGKRGARVLDRSCNFRYELYPFVNAKTGPNSYFKS
ncbi:unnamed protein product [Arabidopsis thaliana]|uniref:Putative cysteine-rich repeat secretory protein 17 n=2 Tax=Arabidopsis thaliana TaxID=3702 RepID=CRR17_ARATH|nr:cysteine-rich repeat secretory protein, putative (DUF26) [Arabidopsis thaliana]Q9LRM2.1 RecName: Full=Putative cysteine-rich repeat secretory protein 17; Flags: Precursor [Arabidopsis thaliana]AEE76565.1 cysteine-rich repeat secretory protein, putative (DUF26) [Arabidopsis thaliana]BAB01368.1 unnamed protein product [Arabidopsis thaliana]|eukprot:NP_188829.1 cysteine-rich repeat secretory protein, putative (DUF26) [Arabidopsis thaliana]